MPRYTVSSRVNLDGNTEFYTTVGDDEVTVVAWDYDAAAPDLWTQCKHREAQQVATDTDALDTSEAQPGS